MHGQNYFTEYQEIVSENSLIDSRSKVDTLLQTVKNLDDLEVFAKIAHTFSIAFFKDGDIATSIKYAKLDVYAYSGDDLFSVKYSNAVFNLGWFYAIDNQYTESFKTLNSLIKLKNKDKYNAVAICQIGRNYYDTGDFYKSVFYYEKGFEELTHLGENGRLIQQYINASRAYEEINTKESLASMYNCIIKADSLSDIVSIRPRDRLILNNKFADYYNNDLTFNFESSKKYYQKTIVLAEELGDEELAHAANNNLGFLYNVVKNDSAYIYLDEALKYKYERGSTYHIYADYAVLKKDYKSALEYIHSSIESHTEIIYPIDQSLSIEQLSEEVDLYNVMISLQKKTEILIRLFEVNNNTLYLEQALTNLQTADSLSFQLQNISEEEGSKLYWRNESSSINLLGVYAATLLNDATLAFSYMEKNKAFFLRQAIVENTRTQKLSEVYSSEDRRYRKSISAIENKLLDENSKLLRDSLFYKKLNYEVFKKTVEIANPKLNLDIDLTPLSLSEVHSNLKNDVVIISHLWNENDVFSQALFTLFISKDKIILQKTDSTSILNDVVLNTKKQLQAPFQRNQDQDLFERNTHQLFNLLFSTSEIRNMIQDKHLLIIPDGDLSNLPYEVLMTDVEENSFLVKTNSISYANSISYLIQNNQRKRNSTETFLGVAPITYNYSALVELPNTIHEVSEISEVLNGQNLLGNAATKTGFSQIIDNFKIIHLATHADPGAQPWIAFSDDKMYLNEIYNSKNQAELVVLSACNTAQGEVVKGEGILSLSRGFFYAGANSVLSNAWEANDKSAREIMQSFYSYLSDGDTKAKALQKAKIEYLNKHSLFELSPHYWASFMVVGDYGKIYETPSLFSIYSFIIIFFILVLGAFYIIKKNRKISSN